MSRFYYYLKVYILSIEFFLILSSSLLFFVFGGDVDVLIKDAKIDPDFIKYLVLLPVSFFVWIVKEAKDMIVAEKDHLKILVNWPDYHKFKIHVNASLVFSLFFVLMSCVPCLGIFPVKSAVSVFFLATGIVGGFVVAAVIYFAQISLKEIFNKDWRVS